jgi:K+-transporting ATPase ATPase C chain
MFSHLRANLWLLILTLLVCSVLYPGALLILGKTVLRQQAEGSLVYDAEGVAIGSRLVAQPFTGKEYFQPRPSAAAYNGAATAGSNWGANNYLLRDRVARQLGLIARYRSGSRQGQSVAADLERWFQGDEFQRSTGIVRQWAEAHPLLAQKWVKADPRHADFLTAWQAGHSAEVDQWKSAHPETPAPAPEDLAVLFFTSFAAEHPGAFPALVGRRELDGTTSQQIEPVQEGPDIQSIFFDMWLQDHPGVELQLVPADMVMTSGSGIDPHITMANAHYQLDRVAAAWAEKTGRNQDEVRTEIEQTLNENREAPLGGLVGVDLVNVLEVNLALRAQFGS